MAYAVARTVKRNPEINGRTFYLTNIGFWTLRPTDAWKFTSREEAMRECREDDRIEEVTP